MRALIRWLDALLRRKQGIHEFSDDPEGMFRIRVCLAPKLLRTRTGEIPEGAPVVELHFWNEQLPRLPERGANLAWGKRGLGRVKRSLTTLARQIRETPELGDVRGVIGVTAFFSTIDDAAGAGQRIVRRLGFECEPYRSRLGRFGERFEDIHTRAMLWAFNEHWVRRNRRARVSRMLIWMSADELARRYAPPDA